MQAFAFIAVAVLAILLALLALLRIGAMRLDSPLGVTRDGLAEGSTAPAWCLSDASGQIHGVPSEARWQLLVFTDHSLLNFRELATAISRLQASEPDLEALLVARGEPALTVAVCEMLELDAPVVPVDDDFYWRHNVRVMPYLFVLDPRGTVRATGNVVFERTLQRMWRLARLPASSSGPAGARAGRLGTPRS